MKIVLFDLIFNPDKPGITGLSDIAWELGSALADLGKDVHIVAPYNPGTHGPEGVILHTYHVPEIYHRNIIGRILKVIKGWMLIRRELSDADVLHAQEYLSTSIFSLLGPIPVILTTPGNIFERIYNNSNPHEIFTTIILKLAVRISAVKCSSIMATSNMMRYWWEQCGTPPENIVLIPLGVDINTFHPVTGAKQRLGWDKEKKTYPLCRTLITGKRC